ncbi:hypothetical protein B0H13DRAFT_2325816 [Mycena leptocephala]|nr:hypothetical protein B0H13DRAFT_2325816 [Mycena leptocephala]
MVNAKALQIIKKNRSNQLSTATLETYSSYLLWDYISWATKTAILEELAKRILVGGACPLCFRGIG